MQYRKLTEAEMSLYYQEMYDYSAVSFGLFHDIFKCNYDWGLFGYDYDMPIDHLSNGIPESPQVENFTDHTNKGFSYITWILSKKEQEKLIEKMKSQNIQKERKEQYINGFPYISAIVIIYRGFYDPDSKSGNSAYEKFGFYPYSGKLLERFTPEYKKKHLKEEIIRRHRIHFGELVRCDSFDIKLNKKEMNELKKLNDGRYYLLKQKEKEIKAINDKYEKKIENYIKETTQNL